MDGYDGEQVDWKEGRGGKRLEVLGEQLSRQGEEWEIVEPSLEWSIQRRCLQSEGNQAWCGVIEAILVTGMG